MDKISIIIPTYNRFNYLLNTIKSIKKQTYSNIEIIVVNDKSTQKEYLLIAILSFISLNFSTI
jgi:glycosyltransferase involved in cell wall biosynthesis